MTPFTMLNPAGKAGSISQTATAPPEFTITISEIVTPRVNVW